MPPEAAVLSARVDERGVLQEPVGSFGASSLRGPANIRIDRAQTDLDSSIAGSLFAQLATTLTTSVLATTTAGSGSPAATPAIVSNGALGNGLFPETPVITATSDAGSAGLDTATQTAARQPMAVPDPASIMLFSTGLLAVGMLTRRRQA
jgi:hypothetical protein